MATRILFVDDEAGIRNTLKPILEQHGFEVTAAATVPEALEHMNHATFDVLLSDLNIGQPGDGFTVVSAMRRVQPQARPLSLRAIRILILHCKPFAARWTITCSSRQMSQR